eukprot:Nitzschia sp. Nitz4//scaffold16_size188269//130393//133293//NITZ4_001806-RA/size188269-augustus-gene-0.81-mRNA-1//1//CDS//3329538562//3209//frame0
MGKEKESLLMDPESPSGYGTVHSHDHSDDDHSHFVPLKQRGWSFQEQRRMIMVPDSVDTEPEEPHRHHHVASHQDSKGFDHYIYCLIYALVNVIISAPGLYGYAAVIFNNAVFNNHMNALSKLVIFSSLVHQLGFLMFSSLDFAIGTVQDAGLIFLSGMANIIANAMLDNGHSEEEIVSTTVVLLSICTATLGVVLVLMGKFRLADAVSYLPMPVVGGYLAFIGYFCIQAGVAMCISKPMMSIIDFKYLINPENLLLATPGLLAGLLLTTVSRTATSSAVLPAVMVGIPALFYFIIWVCDSSLEDARESGWVGPVAPTVPLGDLLQLVKFEQVRWDLIYEILPTWVGMVFVVSFASCLDVAAISIDMGEALDTNRELATVGICNFMSGMTFGFTGSYIFSQTIFTYRTGVHDRIIGVMIMCVFLYIVVSPVNVLQISPLFFLGSTLIFIGYDLMFEWLWEVRHQVFLSGYAIIWLTFSAIHVVGINAGIIIGVLIAIVEQIITTAQTSSVSRVEKRSRAVWKSDDSKILQDYAYSPMGGARIITMEVHGTVFFGSSLGILNGILAEIGQAETVLAPAATPYTPHTPHISSSALTLESKQSVGSFYPASLAPPKYLVLDLTRTTHVDSSATRGCFLQLTKLCAKRGILLCASGTTARIEWMFRSHGVSFSDAEEEEKVKGSMLCHGRDRPPCENMLLFLTTHEAIEFCENMLLHRLNIPGRVASLANLPGPEEQTLGDILADMLSSDDTEKEILSRMDEGRFHNVIHLKSGQKLFSKGSYPDAFYIVLKGVVANSTSQGEIVGKENETVISGAGIVRAKRGSSASSLFDDNFKESLTKKAVLSLWQVGGIFGYNDFVLERPRTFRALATQDGTTVARITRSHTNLAATEDKEVSNVLQKVLLHASSTDLANCTCRDV